MEEAKEEVVEVKMGFKDKFLGFCRKHPDVVLTLVGGVASLAGGIIKIIAAINEYEDNVFTTIDNEVYKIPAKHMKTATYTRTEQ